MDKTYGNRNYSAENIDMINMEYGKLRISLERQIVKNATFAEKLRNERAKEYFLNGVGRRISTIFRCIENIFTIFPVERIIKLSMDELRDCDINLHAFIINIHGIIENLNMGIAHGYGLFDYSKTENQQKYDFGLFNQKFLSKIGGEIESYFSSAEISEWYEEYSKNYRDSLTHRIPAYIPPAGLNDNELLKYNRLVARINEINKTGWTIEVTELLDKINEIGIANPSFVHSAYEKAKVVALHPQLISDYFTVEKMIDIVIDNIDLTIAST